MANRPMSPRKGGSWAKVVIFISLYVLLLESVIEWALVLYLYGNKQVDSKMAPSLILALIASFFTVPLVLLHSILAWQYNKVMGFGNQKKVLRTACTYLLRLTIIVWLAGSVAGLVVISQHVSCLPESASGSFWKVGVSCALHRASVIVSVLSFITVCLYFCSRELCDRPFNVSLLGVYNQQQTLRDESIFSNSSLESDNTLKSDIYYMCRRPDVTYGTRDLYFSPDSNMEKSAYPQGIQHPTPIHPRPQLRLDTYHGSEHTDTTLTGSPISPNSTIYRRSPGASTHTDLYSITRTPTNPTSMPFNEQQYSQALAELPGGPETSTKNGHKRQKSSVSSLRRFLPKAFPLSLPLSADPQIQALADPKVPTDIEKHAESDKAQKRSGFPESQPPAKPEQKPTAPPTIPQHPEPQVPPKTQGPTQSLPRSMTMNSAEAPEVVTPAPLHMRRSTSSHTGPIRTVYQHHPTYTPALPSPLAQHPLSRAPSHRASLVEPDRLNHHSSRRSSRRQSQMYLFEQSQVPRYTRSQYQPTTRHSNNGRFEPRRPSMSRRNDVEIIYPSTRRSRSSTCNGFSSAGHLDCIRETGTSVDEAPGSAFSDNNTYRGTSRTSMLAY